MLSILVPIESAYTYSYKWSIATWTLSCTVSEIRLLKCRKSTIFPTTLLFLLNLACFLWSRSVMLGSAERGKVRLILAVKLFSKNSNLGDHDTILQRHRRTDGRTDNLPWQYRALRSIARKKSWARPRGAQLLAGS